jgi:hypothetical protein
VKIKEMDKFTMKDLDETKFDIGIDPIGLDDRGECKGYLLKDEKGRIEAIVDAKEFDKAMKAKVAIIGQTIGTATEIYDALYGNNTVKIVGIEGMDADKTFSITRIVDDSILFKPPLTRAERRKLERKK